MRLANVVIPYPFRNAAVHFTGNRRGRDEVSSLYFFLRASDRRGGFGVVLEERDVE